MRWSKTHQDKHFFYGNGSTLAWLKKVFGTTIVTTLKDSLEHSPKGEKTFKLLTNKINKYIFNHTKQKPINFEINKCQYNSFKEKKRKTMLLLSDVRFDQYINIM